ncbi:carbonic anhydrase 1-like [Haliotis rubra]|uniref:carbonic anhydrase 1-like n=1 Tax=Haliotis rubra TaxID=36100 RepID=UPI001EE584C7|nr:carbonic anhydrase 1-like [Haliotis rubra]
MTFCFVLFPVQRVCALKGDYYVDGGGLASHYRTAEFHFHWGGDSSQGSEHAINGMKYPLEMHVVNYAEKYGNLSEAMKHPDGLAVLGVFFKVSERDNPSLQPIMSALRNIIHYGSYEVVNNCSVRALLPKDLASFYRYEGSLTTPPCHESVLWTVFTEVQEVSERQARSITDQPGGGVAVHYNKAPTRNRWTPSNHGYVRPIQPPSSSRVVYQRPPPSYHFRYPTPLQRPPQTVYLNTAPKPVRVQKPYFYNFYFNRNSPAPSRYSMSPGGFGGLDFGALGELKKRRRRSHQNIWPECKR